MPRFSECCVSQRKHSSTAEGSNTKKAPANEKRAKDTSVTEQMVYKEKKNKKRKLVVIVVQCKTTKKERK